MSLPKIYIKTCKNDETSWTSMIAFDWKYYKKEYWVDGLDGYVGKWKL